jgi:hypothetical protein
MRADRMGGINPAGGLLNWYTSKSKSLSPLVGREVLQMSRLAQAIRSRREYRRTHRDLNVAIINAATPSLRDELILVGQRTD